MGLIARKYSSSSHTLKPRLARSCLKTFLDPAKPFGAHYGSIIGLHAVGGPEAVRVLILPNLATYSNNLLRDGLAEDNPRRPETERVVGALLAVLTTLREGHPGAVPQTNGHAAGVTEDVRERLTGKVGDLIATRIGDGQLARVILEA